MRPSKLPEFESLLDREAVCCRLLCSKSTLKRYAQRGWLTPIRIGPRMVRYRREDVLEFENRGKAADTTSSNASIRPSMGHTQVSKPASRSMLQ